MEEAHFGGDNIESAPSLHDLASSLAEAGEAGRALELQERMVTIASLRQGSYHDRSWIRRSRLQLDRCRSPTTGDKAREAEERLVTIEEPHYGKDHIKKVVGASILASSLAEAGEAGRALELRERVVTIEERHYGKGHIMTVAGFGKLACSLIDASEFDKARALRERVVTIEERHYGKGHIRTEVGLRGYNDLTLLTAARPLGNTRGVCPCLWADGGGRVAWPVGKHPRSSSLPATALPSQCIMLPLHAGEFVADDA